MDEPIKGGHRSTAYDVRRRVDRHRNKRYRWKSETRRRPHERDAVAEVAGPSECSRYGRHRRRRQCRGRRTVNRKRKPAGNPLGQQLGDGAVDELATAHATTPTGAADVRDEREIGVVAKIQPGTVCAETGADEWRRCRGPAVNAATYAPAQRDPGQPAVAKQRSRHQGGVHPAWGPESQQARVRLSPDSGEWSDGEVRPRRRAARSSQFTGFGQPLERVMVVADDAMMHLRQAGASEVMMVSGRRREAGGQRPDGQLDRNGREGGVLTQQLQPENVDEQNKMQSACSARCVRFTATPSAARKTMTSASDRSRIRRCRRTGIEAVSRRLMAEGPDPTRRLPSMHRLTTRAIGIARPSSTQFRGQGLRLRHSARARGSRPVQPRERGPQLKVGGGDRVEFGPRQAGTTRA